MGKQNKKQATGTNHVIHSDSGIISSFDEKALSALTAKIEKGFENNLESQQIPVTKKVKNGHDLQTHTSKEKVFELVKGTKRDVNGRAKQSASKPAKRAKNSENEKDERAMLLQEILSLGGTEEDLDLIADAISDEEDESPTSPPDGLFRKDLAKFVAGLGIEGNFGEDESEGEVLVDEEEDGIWEASESTSSEDADIESDHEVASVPQKLPAVIKCSPDDLNRLIFEARPDWHAAPLHSLPNPDKSELSNYRDATENLHKYAKLLLEVDTDLYASKHLSSSSSHRFLSTIMASGTLSDKVSALTLVVQESPVHTTKSFDSLLTLAKKRSRGQAVTALGALKDLLGVGVVLPADRRLRAFAFQPGLLGTLQAKSIFTWSQGQNLPGNISKAHLISWAYEDWLKEAYFEMLKVLEGWCNDEVEYARTQAVTYVYELLKEKPEQEANLLRLLVNKLGDPDKKIASRTSYLLLQMQNSHPLMKSVIIRSVESELLLRPGQSSHAKYYAINTLNQTILSGREEEVARKLLSIYFDLFVVLLKKPEPPPDLTLVNKKGQAQGGGAPMGKKAKEKAAKEAESKLANEESTEKMISAVLTGVNRAFPFSKNDDDTLEKHMDTLFRITHSSNFNTSVQALMLIEQLSTSKHLSVDRFYRTLYESLLDPRLVNSSKHALYLNLLFRALRSDLSVKRVKAFAKRMLQIVHLHQPPFICGILYLLRELENTCPALKTLLNDPEEADEADGDALQDAVEGGEARNPGTIMQTPIFRVMNHYDGRKRDPEHSNADKSCLWEAVPFLAHFHPSVSLFATRLLNGETMPPKPNLASHSLSNFLDRFVYRNAKSAAGGSRGGSIMQPLSGGDSKGILLSKRSTSHTQGPVNTEAFWRQKATDVAVDEVFFHKYFSQLGKSKKVSGEKKKAHRGEEDEDEENEDEIWQALVDSRPEVEGENEDSDMDMLDLDELDPESSASESVNGDDEDLELESDVSDVDKFDVTNAGEGSSTGENGADSEIDDLFAKELQTAQPAKVDEESSRSKKRRLKSLPTFASVEDYAGMLDNDDDEDL